MIRSGLLFLAAATAACSSGNPSPATGPAVAESDAALSVVGSIGTELLLPGGTETIDQISYVLMNGTTPLYSGVIDVSNAGANSFVIGNIPAGADYTLQLSATSVDGSVTCSGTTSGISIEDRTSTPVEVNLVCTSNVSLDGGGGAGEDGASD